MSIATEILSLRRDRSSSVERLLAAVEWQKEALDDSRMLMRGHAVMEAADTVLLKVAAHAAETQRFFDQGGSVSTPARRAARPRKRFPWLGRDPRATRQLHFASFYN